MDYFIIDQSTPEDAPRQLDVSPLAPFGMYLGKPLAMPLAGVQVKVSTLKGILDLWGVGSYFLVSQRALEVLKGAGETKYQVFPVSVVPKAGKRDETTIRIVHLLDNIACMDKCATDYDTAEDDENDICGIRRLVLLKKAIPPSRHLFRLAEFSSVIIASEKLVDMLKAINARGAKFVPPEGYKTGCHGVRHVPTR